MAVELQLQQLLLAKRQSQQCKSLLTEYEKVDQLLVDFNHKLNHKVMVPLNNLAFVPGKLYATNQFLVLLGENYFVEKSLVETRQLLGRRKEYLNLQLEALTPNLNFLNQELGLKDKQGKDLNVKEYQVGGNKFVDIREEYNSDEEKVKEKVVEPKQAMNKVKSKEEEDFDRRLLAFMSNIEDDQEQEQEQEPIEKNLELKVETKATPHTEKVQLEPAQPIVKGKTAKEAEFDQRLLEFMSQVETDSDEGDEESDDVKPYPTYKKSQYSSEEEGEEEVEDEDLVYSEGRNYTNTYDSDSQPSQDEEIVWEDQVLGPSKVKLVEEVTDGVEEEEGVPEGIGQLMHQFHQAQQAHMKRSKAHPTHPENRNQGKKQVHFAPTVQEPSTRPPEAFRSGIQGELYQQLLAGNYSALYDALPEVSSEVESDFIIDSSEFAGGLDQPQVGTMEPLEGTLEGEAELGAEMPKPKGKVMELKVKERPLQLQDPEQLERDLEFKMVQDQYHQFKSQFILGTSGYNSTLEEREIKEITRYETQDKPVKKMSRFKMAQLNALKR